MINKELLATYALIVSYLFVSRSINCNVLPILSHEKLGSQLKLSCQFTNNKDQFYKNGEAIANFNSSHHYQYFDSTNVNLIIGRLNLSDDGEKIYKAVKNNNLNLMSCEYNIFLCENQSEFSTNLTVEINGQQFNAQNNNSNITIQDPLNVTIDYYYQIKALPLSPSSLQFIRIANKTIDRNCSNENDTLRCYEGNGSIEINLEECKHSQLIVQPQQYNNSTAIVPFQNKCDLNYTIDPLIINLHYIHANISVNNTNSYVKLNDVLQFNYKVICANPQYYLYTLNCSYSMHTNRTLIYHEQFNYTNESNFSYMYQINVPFDVLNCTYCIDNYVTQRCQTNFYYFNDTQETSSTTTGAVETYITEITKQSTSTRFEQSFTSDETRETSTVTTIGTQTSEQSFTSEETHISISVNTQFSTTNISVSDFSTRTTKSIDTTTSDKTTLESSSETSTEVIVKTSAVNLISHTSVLIIADSRIQSSTIGIICGSIAGVILVLIVITVVIISKKKIKLRQHRETPEKSLTDIPLTNANGYSSFNETQTSNVSKSKPVPQREILDNELYGLPESPNTDHRKSKAKDLRSKNKYNVYSLTDEQIKVLYSNPINQLIKTKPTTETPTNSGYEDIYA